MSLQTRLGALITAVGADIKLIKAITKVTDFSPDRTVEVLAKALTSSGTGWLNLTAQDARATYLKKSGLYIYRTDPLGGYQGVVTAYADEETPGVGRYERIIIDSQGYSDFAEAIPVVQVLPTTGLYHGKTVCFQNQSMMNNGIAWILRYRLYNVNGSVNTNADKWEYVGGGVFYSRDPAAIGLSPTTTFNGPEHTIPLPGWYEVSTAFNGYNSGTGAGIISCAHYNASNAVIEASGENNLQGYLVGSTSARTQPSRTALFSVALTAGQIMRLGWSSEVASGHNIRWRSLGIKPIRVSAA